MNSLLPDIDKLGYISLLPAWVAVITGIAAFNNGGYFFTTSTICQLLVLATLLLLLLFNSDIIIRSWSAESLVSLFFISALAVWIGLTFIWSIARDETIIEFLRAASYAGVFVLGCQAGWYRVRPLSATLPFTVLFGAVMVYAIAAKSIPSFFQPFEAAHRVFQPIGYTNALACFAAMGLMLALPASVCNRIKTAARALFIIISYLAGMVILLSLSRGTIVAALIAGIILLVFSPSRLQVLLASLTAIVPAAIVMAWVRNQPALMQSGVELELRSAAGVDLAIRIIAGLIACLTLFLLVTYLRKYKIIPQGLSRRTTATVLVASAVVMLSISAYYAIQLPSFTEWADEKIDEFTRAEFPPAGPERMTSLQSGMRWQLWKEAYAEWKDHPLTGTGGQTFELIHLKRREIDLFVKQSHSLPIGLLVETGILGLMLLVSFMFATYYSSVKKVLRMKMPETDLAAGILALMVAYTMQTSYDWNWNIPALSLIAFFFAGYLVNYRNEGIAT